MKGGRKYVGTVISTSPGWVTVDIDGTTHTAVLPDQVRATMTADEIAVLVHDGRRLVAVGTFLQPPPMAHTATLADLTYDQDPGSPWLIPLVGATAGRSAILWLWHGSGGGVPTVTDNAGNTWTLINGTNVGYFFVYKTTFTAGVPTQVSVSGLLASGYAFYACEEFLPIGTVLGATVYASGGATQSLTPTASTGLAIAHVGINTTRAVVLTGGTWDVRFINMFGDVISYAWNILPTTTVSGRVDGSSANPAFGVELRLLNLPA